MLKVAPLCCGSEEKMVFRSLLVAVALFRCLRLSPIPRSCLLVISMFNSCSCSAEGPGKLVVSLRGWHQSLSCCHDSLWSAAQPTLLNTRALRKGKAEKISLLRFHYERRGSYNVRGGAWAGVFDSQSLAVGRSHPHTSRRVSHFSHIIFNMESLVIE
jgi:hypothetical protein